MSFEFEMKVFRLASNQREILDKGEKLFKKESEALGFEKYFDTDYLASPKVREQASEILATYQKQLILEKNFYMEFHDSFIKEINKLVCELSSDEREKFLIRSTSGLEENNLIRININKEKNEAITKLVRLINLYNSNDVTKIEVNEQIVLNNHEDINEIESLLKEIDSHLDKQEYLGMIQRKRSIDGQRFIERVINLFKNS